MTNNNPIVSASVCDSFMSTGKSLAALYAFATLAAESLAVDVDSDVAPVSGVVTVAPLSGATVRA